MTAPKIPAVINVFQNVLGGPAVLHEPHFTGNEWTYVKECIDTGWVSTAGAYVERFEDMLCHVTGVKHAIATVNGTAALHAAMILAGVKPGDEVIVPSLTFVATANAVTMAGAIPHFAVAEIDGHDTSSIKECLQNVPLEQNKPTAIICHTIKGKGFKFAENKPEWHHKSNFKDEDIQQMYKALDDLKSQL